MKKHTVFCMIICGLALSVSAQKSSDLPENVLTEKKFELQTKEGVMDTYLFDSSSGRVWKLDEGTRSWKDLGQPPAAEPRRRGTYQLLIYSYGELIVLDSESGKSWWNDGKSWEVMEQERS